jgi:hypothetical protein
MNHDKIDDVILLALAELSFASVRNLSWLFQIPRNF